MASFFSVPLLSRIVKVGFCAVVTVGIFFAAGAAHAAEIIVDDGGTGYTDTGWSLSSTIGYGGDAHFRPTGTGTHSATWTPTISVPGNYRVYVSWTAHSNRATNAPYTVTHANGSSSFVVNQERLADQVTIGAAGQWSDWHLLGTFLFTAGTSGKVTLTDAANEFVISDAVRFVSTTLSVPTDYPTIQAAIDAASAGDTVIVAAGSFTEQLVISKNIILVGAGSGATILHTPASLVGDVSGSKNLITISGAGSVLMSDIGLVADNGALDTGVYVRDGANAVLDSVSLTRLGGGSVYTGILTGREAHNTIGSVVVNASSISGYTKGGITIDNTGSFGEITGNTVVGSGVNPTVAQNGIQVSRGATATISGNTIQNHQCTNAGAGCTDDPTSSATADGATGILLYGAGNPVEIFENTLNGNQFNIWSVASENISIHDNTLTGASGVGIAVWDADQWTAGFGLSESATAGLITKNTIQSHDYGFLIRDYISGGAAPLVTAIDNRIMGNVPYGAWSNTAFPAEMNWWGSCDGPYHPVANALSNGDRVSDFVDYTPWQMCSIRGIKFDDTNGNGVKDDGEPGLSGWTIRAQKQVQTLTLPSDGTVVSSGILESGKEYSIYISGTYTAGDSITADAQYSVRAPNTEWTDSVQNYEQYGPTLLDVQINGVSPNWGAFQSSHVYSIPYTGTGAPIQFRVNDVYYPGNSGSFTITLSSFMTTTTDASGNYSFNDLVSGDYRITEQQQNGWVATMPSVPGYYDVSLTNADSAGRDFGNFKLAELHGIKYEDMNGNGHFDDSDHPLAHWHITLAGPNGFTKTVVTDADGAYAFLDIAPGLYTLTESYDPDIWYQSEPGNGGYGVLPQSGEVMQNVNFGNVKFSSIQGIKYKDLNFNGVNDTEPAIGNWKIELTNLSTAQKVVALTNAQGMFVFDHLPPARYLVREILQAGWMPVNPKSSFYFVDIVSGTDRTGIEFGNNTVAAYKKWRLQNAGISLPVQAHAQQVVNTFSQQPTLPDAQDTASTNTQQQNQQIPASPAPLPTQQVIETIRNQMHDRVERTIRSR